MNFLLDNWVLVLVAVSSGAMLLWPGVSESLQSGGLSPSAAVLLMNRERAVVVDVCEVEEFKAGHVAGARNIPFADLERRLPEVVKNKALPVILMCATGARAKRAVATAQKLGYDKAQALSGGLGAWREANLPLEKT